MPNLATFSGTVHVVFSSHWDREWYLPFQKFRGKLVAMLDRIFDELESGRLAAYQMDGQFIPVEDYLQIRPEKEALIRRLIAEGRFKVGPWYDLPDVFLVSGESIIRNFQLGMQRAEAFGQTAKVGWLCDIFGHNSQMPQILAQLGIDNAILWRGVDPSIKSPLRWEGADGTQILAHRFPENGYTDFAFDVRKANKADEIPTMEEMVCNALKHFEKLAGSSTANDLLMFDGADHMEFNPVIVELLERLNQQAGREVFKVSTLDAYLAALRLEKLETPVIRGEQRRTATMETFGWLIPGVGSSRIPLKQANHASETLLTLWAEPWCATARQTLGAEYPFRALELAWEYLLKNHPHDSICGCSPDATHDAMPYRFEQSRQIAEFHLDAALNAVAAAALHDQLSPGEIGLSLFAPAAGLPQSAPEAQVRLPKDWPQFSEFFGFETKPSLRIVDTEGRDVAYQLLQVTPSSAHLRMPPMHFPCAEDRQGIRLALETIVTPGEVRHFILKRAEGPTRNASQSRIGIGRATLRNKRLVVSAQPDGTLTITDLATGRAYPGLLAMEDTADIGDGWFHGIALQDRPCLSTGGNVSFGVIENGPLLARLQIRVEWQVPAEFDFHANVRGSSYAPLVVEHVVTLRKGADHAEVETTVANTVRDHRLRLLCPTGLAAADTFWADTPFDAVERPIALGDTHTQREIQVEMTPQQNWVALSDHTQGLALLAPGQYESAVLDQPDRPLCVTLLRSFRRAVFTDGNDGGQIQGTHRFRLALKPFSGEVPATDLFQLAQAIAAPVRTVTTELPDLRHLAPITTKSALRPRAEGPVVLTACQLSAPDQWTLRVFNPSDEPQTVQLSGARAWSVVNFRGENPEPVSEPTATVQPRQILTLLASA